MKQIDLFTENNSTFYPLFSIFKHDEVFFALKSFSSFFFYFSEIIFVT